MTDVLSCSQYHLRFPLSKVCFALLRRRLPNTLSSCLLWRVRYHVRLRQTRLKVITLNQRVLLRRGRTSNRVVRACIVCRANIRRSGTNSLRFYSTRVNTVVACGRLRQEFIPQSFSLTDVKEKSILPLLGIPAQLFCSLWSRHCQSEGGRTEYYLFVVRIEDVNPTLHSYKTSFVIYIPRDVGKHARYGVKLPYTVRHQHYLQIFPDESRLILLTISEDTFFGLNPKARRASRSAGVSLPDRD